MKIKFILVFFLLTMSNVAFCYYEAWNNATIQDVIVHDDGTDNYAGTVHVVMQTTLLAKPSCASSTDRFIIDLSRGPGKSQYSAVLAAQMAGKPISVHLNETCIGGTALVRNIIVSK